VRWLHADLTDPRGLDALGEHDAIVHCAAALPTSFAESSPQAKVNRLIDTHVLDRGRKWHAAVVYASSASLYGPRRTGEAQLSETDPIRAAGPYLQEKAWAEDYGLQLSNEGGGAFTALRINAPYGPDQTTRTVLTLFIECALRGQPLAYWGNGTREQDFTYADDVADACTCALRGPGGVFNIASGRPRSTRELALMVAEITGAGPDAVTRAERPDPQEGYSARYDIGAARRILGWGPRVPLREGLERVVRQRRGLRG
jgi:nucleoside-diphosphate-sugar epimerase